AIEALAPKGSGASSRLALCDCAEPTTRDPAGRSSSPPRWCWRAANRYASSAPGRASGGEPRLQRRLVQDASRLLRDGLAGASDSRGLDRVICSLTDEAPLVLDAGRPDNPGLVRLTPRILAATLGYRLSLVRRSLRAQVTCLTSTTGACDRSPTTKVALPPATT